MTLPARKEIYPPPLYHLVERNRQVAERQNKELGASCLLPTNLTAFLEAVAQSARRNTPQPPSACLKARDLNVPSLSQDYQAAHHQLIDYCHQQLIQKVHVSVANVLFDSTATQRVQNSAKQQSAAQVQASVKAILKERLGLINDQFPQQLDAYLIDVVEKTKDSLKQKSHIFDGLTNVYLKTVHLLDRYFQGLQKQRQLKLPPIYEQQTQLVREMKQQFVHSAESLYSQLGDFRSQTQMQTIKQVLEKTKATMKQSAEKMMLDFEVQWKQRATQSLNEHQMVGLAQRALDFYAYSLDNYFNLITSSINLFVENMDQQLNLLSVHLDSRIQLFVQKEKLILDFLDHESTMLLKAAEVGQKPQLSKLFGFKKGCFFDDTPLRIHGNVTKIAMFITTCEGMGGSPRCFAPATSYPPPINFGIQLTYGKRLGPLRGDSSSLKNEVIIDKYNPLKVSLLKQEFALDVDERIVKVDVVLSTAMEIYDLFFFTHKDRNFDCYIGKDYTTSPFFFTNEDRKFPLYVKKDYAFPSLYEIETATFGSEYYLASIQGYTSPNSIDRCHMKLDNFHQLEGITFAFLRDFSSIINQPLERRLDGAIDMLDQVSLENLHHHELIEQLQQPPEESFLHNSSVMRQSEIFLKPSERRNVEKSPPGSSNRHPLKRSESHFKDVKEVNPYHPPQSSQSSLKICLLPTPSKSELNELDSYLLQQTPQRLRTQLSTLAYQHQKPLKELIEQALKWQLQEAGKEKLRYILMMMGL